MSVQQVSAAAAAANRRRTKPKCKRQRKRVLFRVQNDDPEANDYFCGPAAVENALKHLGLRVPQDLDAMASDEFGTRPKEDMHFGPLSRPADLVHASPIRKALDRDDACVVLLHGLAPKPGEAFHSDNVKNIRHWACIHAHDKEGEGGSRRYMVRNALVPIKKGRSAAWSFGDRIFESLHELEAELLNDAKDLCGNQMPHAFSFPKDDTVIELV